MIVRKWAWEMKRMQAQRISAWLIVSAVLISLLLCAVLTRTENYENYARISNAYFSKPSEEREAFVDSLETASTSLFIDMEEKNAIPDGMIPDSMEERIRLNDALRSFISDRESVLSYSSYVQEIQSQSKRMQLLAKRTGKQDYTVLKMQKESDAYAALADVIPVFDHNAGVHFFMDAPGFFALAFLVPLGLALCVYDQDRYWLELIKVTPAGNKKVLKTKLGILMLYAFGFSVITQAVYFLWAWLVLGCGDLGRPVQSVFVNCVLTCSVGMLMMIAFLLRSLAVCLVAVLALLMSMILRENVLSIPVTLAISLSGWLLQKNNVANEAAHFIRKMNPWIYLKPGDLFCISDYLNVFGKPFFTGYASVAFCVLYIFLLAVMCSWRYACLESKERHGCMGLRRQKLGSTRHLWQHEMYAFWIGRGAWRLFVVFLLILGLFSFSLKPEMTVYDKYLYYHIDEARKHEDPEVYLNEAYNRSMETEMPNPNERQALTDAIVQYNTLCSRTFGKEDFKFETGYRYLLTERSGIIFRSVLTVLMLLMMAILFQDRGYSGLMRTYPGYTNAYKRYTVFFCILSALLVTVPIQGLYLLQTNTGLGLPDIHADVYSLSFMTGFKGISFLNFFLGLLVLRYLLAFGLERCFIWLIESRHSRVSG